MSHSDEEQPARSFKVQDRRRFTNPEPAAAEGEADKAGDEPTPSSAGVVLGESVEELADASALAAMTFSTFVISLMTQALVHLGEIADPASQSVARDLPAAQQLIDLLGILSEKTKGNLDAGEEQLLGNMLYDLRMRYVEVSRNR